MRPMTCGVLSPPTVKSPIEETKKCILEQRASHRVSHCGRCCHAELPTHPCCTSSPVINKKESYTIVSAFTSFSFEQKDVILFPVFHKAIAINIIVSPR